MLAQYRTPRSYAGKLAQYCMSRCHTLAQYRTPTSTARQCSGTPDQYRARHECMARSTARGWLRARRGTQRGT
eukprot:647370-Rhodomonas_salina.3